MCKVRGIAILSIITALFCSAIIGGNAFAAEAGGWIGVGSGTAGSAPSGGGGTGCDTASAWRYREDCTGASWMFYETVDTNNTDDVTFAYTKYLYLGNGKLGQTVTIPATCSQHEHGGVWIYGINGQANKTGLGFSFLGLPSQYIGSNYATQDGNWGHWAAAGFGLVSWLRDQAKPNVYQELKAGDKTVYRTSNEVYLDALTKVNLGGSVVSTNPTLMEAYRNALKYSGSSYTGDGIQKGTYAFCYWPGMTSTEYSTQTYGTNSKLTTASTTGINGGALKTVNTAPVYASVNEKVTLTFSHNAYSSTATENVSWRMTRNAALASNSNYTVSQKSGAGLTNTTSGNGVKFDYPENGKFTTNIRNGKSGNYSYLVREQFEVTFLKENSNGYNFCEMMGVGPDGQITDHTQVCTRIIVSGCEGGDCPTPPSPSGGGPLDNTCGDGTLGTYSTGTTSVLSRVVNPRLVSTFKDWRTLTYAKPNDPIYWTNCYFPGVQEHYNKDLVTRNDVVIGTHGAHNVCSNTSNTYSKFQSGITWTNEVTLNTTSPRGFNDWTLVGSGAFNLTPKLDNGNYATQTYKNSYRIALRDDAGKEYKDDITTPGTPVSTSYTSDTTHSWMKCCGCGCCETEKCKCKCCDGTYSHTNAYTYGTYSNGERKDESQVKVPYNFVNTAGVNVSIYSYNVMDAVYAGERINVNEPWVKVSPRENKVTEYNYATQVDNAQVRLVAYASSSPNGGARIIKGNSGSDVCGLINDDMSGYCNTVTRNDGIVLNENGYIENELQYTNTIPYDGETFNGVYNVYDVAAGNQMCFVMAVYPYTSGTDDNLDKNGDYNWYISAPACKTVAKKPSVQVYGGGVFSAGSIKTNTSDKINILGYYGYTSQGANDRRVFGSWAEQGVIANGLVEGFASGAAAGRLYVGDVLGGSPEGSVVSFCKNRVPLSFANASSSYISGICPGNEMSGLLGVGVSTVNRQAMVDYFAAGTKTGERDGDYEKIASGTGKNIYVAEVTSDNYTIGGRTLGANETRVVKVAGNVNISENIIYNKGLNYTILNTPKMVIYASGNINIGCGVGEIDALLIAGGTVYTCSGYTAMDSGTWNNAARSRKLTIRGTIVASRIDFSRTWGNTVGAGTGEPAEEINYDTSAILWGRSMADAGESDTFTTVYQHELAPRY